MSTQPSPPTNVGFEEDIVPLFRPMDVECMRNMAILLVNYEYMSDPSPSGQGADPFFADHANARMVYYMLDPPPDANVDRMPMGGPFWSEYYLALYQNWMANGFPQHRS